MNLLEIITTEWITDWRERLPFHLRMNRYRGFARLCFQILTILFYLCKAGLFFSIIFLYICFCLPIKWAFKQDNQDEHDEDNEDDDDYDSDAFWNTAISIENLSDTDFEHFCADLLRINGFSDVRVTSGSGDHGINLLAEKDDMKWAFQCKRWGQETHIGNDVIQKTFAEKAFYHCDIAVVITTSSFTRKAEEYAKETGVLLWGQDKLYKLMEKMNDTQIAQIAYRYP